MAAPRPSSHSAESHHAQLGGIGQDDVVHLAHRGQRVGLGHVVEARAVRWERAPAVAQQRTALDHAQRGRVGVQAVPHRFLGAGAAVELGLQARADRPAPRRSGTAPATSATGKSAPSLGERQRGQDGAGGRTGPHLTGEGEHEPAGRDRRGDGDHRPAHPRRRGRSSSMTAATAQQNIARPSAPASRNGPRARPSWMPERRVDDERREDQRVRTDHLEEGGGSEVGADDGERHRAGSSRWRSVAKAAGATR